MDFWEKSMNFCLIFYRTYFYMASTLSWSFREIGIYLQFLTNTIAKIFENQELQSTAYQNHLQFLVYFLALLLHQRRSIFLLKNV